ncbi:hypothetical protein HPP92_011724 [Vanilla planifolia]|uniref:Uncharacterized protein n=1 Tax=Vanilla planifolia TaxID=51239 RepID=A0A835QYU8_VANPL|nr:hypothetical protein HPP92_012077 [Vanilla planifolia]KAG0483640.1 hypothetical protein HPP92_011724 [Vanilla planifolia]
MSPCFLMPGSLSHDFSCASLLMEGRSCDVSKSFRGRTKGPQRNGFLLQNKVQHMEGYIGPCGNSFMIANDQSGFVVPLSLEEESFLWESSDFQDNWLLEENDSNIHMCEESSSSSPYADGLLFDCNMWSADDFFHDLPELEVQNSMEDSFLEKDLMSLRQPYQSLYIPDLMHVPWSPENLLASYLEDSELLKKDSSMGEAFCPHSGAQYFVKPSNGFITENTTANEASEPPCLKATVLKELEHVMSQLDGKTRICIRDAFYRLANGLKEQHCLDLDDTGMIIGKPTYFDGNLREELSICNEPRIAAIDRVVATLIFH